MHFPTFLLVATLLVALPLASFAADCSGGNPVGTCGGPSLANRNDQYNARQIYCGNNLWRTTSCFVDGRVKIKLNQPGANTQQVCWDALENIIDQCGASSMRGVYNYNGAQYMLDRCVASDGGC